MTAGKEGMVVCDELFQGGHGLAAAFDAAIACDGCVDEGIVRPFLAEAAVQEEEQVQDGRRRVDEFLFIFPVEEGNRPGFLIVGDVPQGRPAVVQAGGVELGQSLAGFFKGIVADGGVNARAAMRSAFYSVRINLKSIKDETFVTKMINEIREIEEKAAIVEQNVEYEYRKR